ncbi:UDP-3-O-(3-hydroxymyristoyl)glucosamine N-acyltransferase [uncultured Maribacter sp.]|uniref:UDP-3-O-(3-hydroxymyristoyl)glucosamine N-acyltransferase n=1 Tax=uncultured Maribacter sp. TaxID=431308 RepID=UPI0026329B5F|nr:UDP-3-O-(3-hydroxymyristoyl)glucosamine N-acyltransferase [uncultured Maribacter sp.]
MHAFSIQEINTILSGELIGDTLKKITGLNQLKNATPNQITFIGSKKHTALWKDSKACAAIVSENIHVAPKDNQAVIKVKCADLAMAKLLGVFSPEPPVFESEIHPTAVIHKTATISKGAQIGANSYIGKNVTIAEGVIVYPNVSIFDDSEIGANTTIWSGTVIRERSIIGAHCIFHNNVSIGADGFGYRPSEDGKGLVKIPHIGNVVIGNYVEVGANSCIDRGKFSSTILGDGCKIDNLVQIGHNCVLGRCCIMAGSSGLAGSVTLGDGVIIGGSASINDHTTIHAGAKVGAGSGVVSDVPAGKTVLGYPACDSRDMLKQWVALRRLVNK